MSSSVLSLCSIPSSQVPILMTGLNKIIIRLLLFQHYYYFIKIFIDNIFFLSAIVSVRCNNITLVCSNTYYLYNTAVACELIRFILLYLSTQYNIMISDYACEITKYRKRPRII